MEKQLVIRLNKQGALTKGEYQGAISEVSRIAGCPFSIAQHMVKSMEQYDMGIVISEEELAENCLKDPLPEKELLHIHTEELPWITEMAIAEDGENALTELWLAEKELNLVELLKNEIGKEFYSPVVGEVVLEKITKDGCIFRRRKEGVTIRLSKNGKFPMGEFGEGPECLIFPSKGQRDWSLFKPTWTPKPGERVWVREGGKEWFGRYFSHIGRDGRFACFKCQDKKGGATPWKECVPLEQMPW